MLGYGFIRFFAFDGHNLGKTLRVCNEKRKLFLILRNALSTNETRDNVVDSPTADDVLVSENIRLSDGCTARRTTGTTRTTRTRTDHHRPVVRVWEPPGSVLIAGPWR